MNIMLLRYNDIIIIYEINICESLKWYSHRNTTTISSSILYSIYTMYIISYYGRCRGVSTKTGRGEKLKMLRTTLWKTREPKNCEWWELFVIQFYQLANF